MTPNPNSPLEDPIRPHTYDGISEYDKRLPNWWLMTLYASIIYWVGYWGYYEWFRIGLTGEQEVAQALARIEATKLSSAPSVDDASLWKMSRNATFVEAGKVTFQANCVACHLASMRGKGESPVAIGPDLTDTKWINGGKPMDLYNVIIRGVLVKGMPTWGPVLGANKIAETVAYILSKHSEKDPIEVEVAPTPAAK